MVPKLIAKYFTCFQAIMAEIIAILGHEIQNATKLTCETSETLFYHTLFYQLCFTIPHFLESSLYICITFKIRTLSASLL